MTMLDPADSGNTAGHVNVDTARQDASNASDPAQRASASIRQRRRRTNGYAVFLLLCSFGAVALYSMDAGNRVLRETLNDVELKLAESQQALAAENVDLDRLRELQKTEHQVVAKLQACWNSFRRESQRLELRRFAGQSDWDRILIVQRPAESAFGGSCWIYAPQKGYALVIDSAVFKEQADDSAGRMGAARSGLIDDAYQGPSRQEGTIDIVVNTLSLLEWHVSKADDKDVNELVFSLDGSVVLRRELNRGTAFSHGFLGSTRFLCGSDFRALHDEYGSWMSGSEHWPPENTVSVMREYVLLRTPSNDQMLGVAFRTRLQTAD